jgi:hypothetical protein
MKNIIVIACAAAVLVACDDGRKAQVDRERDATTEALRDQERVIEESAGAARERLEAQEDAAQARIDAQERARKAQLEAEREQVEAEAEARKAEIEAQRRVNEPR